MARDKGISRVRASCSAGTCALPDAPEIASTTSTNTVPADDWYSSGPLRVVKLRDLESRVQAGGEDRRRDISSGSRSEATTDPVLPSIVDVSRLDAARWRDQGGQLVRVTPRSDARKGRICRWALRQGCRWEGRRGLVAELDITDLTPSMASSVGPALQIRDLTRQTSRQLK